MSRTDSLGIRSSVCIEHISLKMIRLLSSFHWIPSGSLRVCAGNIPQISSRISVGWVLPSDVMGSTGIRLHILPKCFAIEEALDPCAGYVLSGTNQAQLEDEHLSSSPQSIYIYLKSSFTCAFSSWSCFAGKGPTSQPENLHSTTYLHAARCMGTKTDTWLRSLLRGKKKKEANTR